MLSQVHLLSFLPRLTSAEDSEAEPRIPHPPRCSLTPHCSDTGCCMSSSSTLGWDGSGVGGCPPLGVPSHRPLPPPLQPLGLQLHGHFRLEPPWPPARLQHYPLCLSSPRSAEGLEASGNWRELGMLVAGVEAQLVPWMKSLGNAPQAVAFPLVEREGTSQERRERNWQGIKWKVAGEGQWSEASPSEMGASLASPRSGRAGFGGTCKVWVHEKGNDPEWSSPNHPSWFPTHLTLGLSCWG